MKCPALCEPLLSFSSFSNRGETQDSEYSTATIEEYKKERESFTKYPLWHYSQLETKFNEDAIRKILGKFAIPTKGITTTVFAGYTGDFATCLSDIGLNVIFTDKRKDWVERAYSLGFESYRYSVDELPKGLIEKTDLFATFEGYQALPISRSESYDVMRLLTVKYGILFAESKRTIELLKKNGESGDTLKVSFGSFKRVYGIKRCFTYTEDKALRLYHFCASDLQRNNLRTDCKVIRYLYNLTPYDERVHLLNGKNAPSNAKAAGMDVSEWWASLKRILEFNQSRISDPYKRALYHIDDPDNFRIFSKMFKVEKDL